MQSKPNGSEESRRPTFSLSGLVVLLASFMLLANCGGGEMEPRQVVSVSIQPTSATAEQDAGVKFTATGTFNKAPGKQANLSARWTSSDATIASTDPQTGLTKCLAMGGPVTISASVPGKGGIVTGFASLVCSTFREPKVTLDPSQLYLRCGQGPNGCYCNSGKIALKNTGNAGLGIDRIEVRNYYFQVFSQTNDCGTQVQAGKSCTITVRFNGFFGRYNGSVLITDNAADSPQVAPLTGEGSCG